MDPLFVKAASIGFAMLLLLAARHKLVKFAAFKEILREYRLLPETIVTPAVCAIVSAEILIALAWLATWTGTASAMIAAGSTVGLLGTYSFAIAFNLLRGRRYVSCGCSLSEAGGEYLSWGLVLRNGVLICVALIAMLPATPRVTGIGGYATIAMALLASALLYTAGAQLLRNAAAIRTRRHGRE
ncbi:MAG: MauE/DoxX family redox-associated membrane protein [Woeseia sp.]